MPRSLESKKRRAMLYLAKINHRPEQSWMIMGSAGAPRKRYTNRMEALTDCSSLARDNPGHRFHALEASGWIEFISEKMES